MHACRAPHRPKPTSKQMLCSFFPITHSFWYASSVAYCSRSRPAEGLEDICQYPQRRAHVQPGWQTRTPHPRTTPIHRLTVYCPLPMPLRTALTQAPSPTLTYTSAPTYSRGRLRQQSVKPVPLPAELHELTMKARKPLHLHKNRHKAHSKDAPFLLLLKMPSSRTRPTRMEIYVPMMGHLLLLSQNPKSICILTAQKNQKQIFFDVYTHD